MRKKQAGDGTEVEAIEEKYGREKKKERKEWPRPAPERIDDEMERERGSRAFVVLRQGES